MMRIERNRRTAAALIMGVMVVGALLSACRDDQRARAELRERTQREEAFCLLAGSLAESLRTELAKPENAKDRMYQGRAGMAESFLSGAAELCAPDDPPPAQEKGEDPMLALLAGNPQPMIQWLDGMIASFSKAKSP